MTDHVVLLAARNRTKRKTVVYMYEAMQNMLESFGVTRSEAIFGLCAAFLQKTGRRLDFLTDQDRLIINKLRRAITS